MLNEDSKPFEAMMQDLCTAFNRPYTPEITRVFWESLRYSSFPEIRKLAAKHREHGKKFPTPHDLKPERAQAPAAPRDTGPDMSSWAIAANKILFVCCFRSERGFKPVGPYDKQGQCLDDSHQRRLLEVKRDYVRMAEEAEKGGEQWDTVEFNRMCREGFQTIIAEADRTFA